MTKLEDTQFWLCVVCFIFLFVAPVVSGLLFFVVILLAVASKARSKT